MRKRKVLLAGMTMLLLAAPGYTYAGMPDGGQAAQARLEMAADKSLLVVVDSMGAISFLQMPVIVDGYTIAPYKPLLESLGFSVKWDEKNRTVTGTKEGLEIQFTIGSQTAKVNGESKNMQAAPELRKGIPFIPLRFLAETDQREVTWKGSSKQIYIQEKNSLLKFRIFSRMEVPFTPTEADQLVKALDKQTGALPELISALPDQYQLKVNLMIAANDLPDVMMLPDPFLFDPKIMDSIFWDITPYLSDYPHLNALPKTVWDGVRMQNGGIYGIPRVKSVNDEKFPAVRADWLKKLGLDTPRTMEDLYTVMRKFKENDPDGNGKNDSFGLVGSTDAIGLGDLAWVENVFNESSGRFKLENGRIVDTVTEPGTREALLWLNKVLREGLLNQDFAVVSEDQAHRLVTDGKAGIAALTESEAWDNLHQLRGTEPFAELVPLISLRAGGKAVTPVGSGQTGMFTISKNVSEAKMKKILKFMDDLLAVREESPQDAAKQGLSTQTRTLIDQFFGFGDVNGWAAPEMPEDVREQYQSVMKQRDEVPFSALTDVDKLLNPKQKAISRQWSSTIKEMKIKFIMGKISIKEWDAFVERTTNDDTHRKMMEALNDAYSHQH